MPGDRKYAMVWPLADYLAEEMEERGWTTVDVATRMPGDYGLNLGTLALILAASSTGGPERFSLSERTAAALTKAFGVSEGYIAGLHQAWLDNPETRQPFDCPEHLYAGIEFPAPPTGGDYER